MLKAKCIPTLTKRAEKSSCRHSNRAERVCKIDAASQIDDGFRDCRGSCQSLLSGCHYDRCVGHAQVAQHSSQHQEL
jgi:hypothetical protein